MTPKQCIEARRLLGLTQSKLAKIADVTQPRLSLFERSGYMAPPLYGQRNRVADLKAALEAAGVTFVDESGGEPRVRLGRADDELR